MAANSIRRSLFFLLLAIATTLLAWVALMIPLLDQLLTPSLEVGQVAVQDMRAPESITYISEVLTEQKRQEDAQRVADIYTPPDTAVARQQLERLRVALAFINSVRADQFATREQKLSDLSALEYLHLNQDIALKILALSDAHWQAVQQESIVVLEQVMRNTIRESRLEDFRRTTPNLVSLSMPEDQASVTAELTAAFIAPNSKLNETATQAAREKAMQQSTPVTRSYLAGEIIVRRGQVLNAANLEAIRQAGLEQSPQKWQEPASAAALVLLMVAFLAYYISRSPSLIQETRSLALIAILFIIFLFGARLTIPGHAVLPYAFPLTAYSLVVSALFGGELALISCLPLAVLTAYGLPNTLEVSLYYTMGSLFGILALGRAQRFASFFWAGIAVALASAMVVLVFRLTQPNTDLIGLATLGAAALFTGLASIGLTMLIQFLAAQFLGLITPMQLVDLTRPDHPLLRMILRDAPGTYQHSLLVANLAEQAAEQIGADALLTRVGALYHDVGKTVNPIFFIENQMPGMINPHDDLDPAISAATIIRHVPDGIDLARKYRLPRRVIDFIAEHHGTTLTRYQCAQALAACGGVEAQLDKSKYRYPGPVPQSRETAILMLADGCEARVRAEQPREEEKLRAMIKDLVDERLSSGQLDHTPITLHELALVIDSLSAALRSMYHPRVQYPSLELPAHANDTVPINGAIPVSLPNQQPTTPKANPPDTGSG